MSTDIKEKYEDIPDDLLDSVDIKSLNPRKNPYVNKLKRQVTINLDENIVVYFKEEAKDSGIPYQTLINLYLSDCVKNKKKLNITWS